jgi:hypothetical protein
VPKQPTTHAALRALLLLALLGLLPLAARANPQAQGQADLQVFLPVIVQPEVTPIFGGQIRPGNVGATADLAAAGNIYWVRYGDVLWSAVEPTPGTRRWDTMAALEQELANLTAHNLTPVLVVRSAPAWAQKVPGATCSAIKSDAYDAFARFLGDLVQRYSQPPYRVRYWEIWNEPDVDPRLVDPNSGFGCWGDHTDPYYGGGSYGEMLQRIYPVMKQADPRAQVVFGGLLLDCDPADPPPDRPAGVCNSALFLEGALRSGGGAAFDVLSYHGYSYWSASPANVDWDLNQSSWRKRGGATLGKLSFLRDVMQRYQANRPILLTEAAVLCTGSAAECGGPYRAAQANSIVRLYMRAAANHLLGAVWYTFDGPGWYASGLLDSAQQPQPAYQSLAFVSTLLRGARYYSALGSGSLEGYRFVRGGDSYEIYWTNDGSQASVPLPANTQNVYTIQGQAIVSPGDRLIVGFEPVIVELREGTHAP